MPKDVKYIYVIENTTTGDIKIGRSINPEKRWKQLQTGNADTLKLVMVKERANSLKFERWLHTQFGYCRKNGEWFFGITAADVSSALMGCLNWDWD